jgi:hypothetical protein
MIGWAMSKAEISGAVRFSNPAHFNDVYDKQLRWSCAEGAGILQVPHKARHPCPKIPTASLCGFTMRRDNRLGDKGYE